MKRLLVIFFLINPVLAFSQNVKIVEVFRVKLTLPISLDSNLDSVYKHTLENQNPDFIEKYINKLKVAEFYNDTDLNNNVGKRWVYNKSGNLIKHYDDGSQSDSTIKYYDNRERLIQSKIILLGDAEVSEYFRYKGDTCFHYIGSDLFQKSVTEKKKHKKDKIEIKWKLDSLNRKRRGNISIRNLKNQTLEEGEIVDGITSIYSKTIFNNGIPKFYFLLSENKIYMMNVYREKLN